MTVMELKNILERIEHNYDVKIDFLFENESETQSVDLRSIKISPEIGTVTLSIED